MKTEISNSIWVYYKVYTIKKKEKQTQINDFPDFWTSPDGES